MNILSILVNYHEYHMWIFIMVISTNKSNPKLVYFTDLLCTNSWWKLTKVDCVMGDAFLKREVVTKIIQFKLAMVNINVHNVVFCLEGNFLYLHAYHIYFVVCSIILAKRSRLPLRRGPVLFCISLFLRKTAPLEP